MSRYTTRPRAAWIADDVWDEPLRPDLQVPGPAEVDTGLVTHAGDPIFRIQPPIGFGRDDEW